MRWVLVKKFAEMSGYSEEAVRQKIKKSVWLWGVHYRKAPDGRLVVNIEEVEKWLESTSA